MSETNGKVRSAWQRKKYVLTWATFLGGMTIGLLTGATLGEYTAFSTMILGVFVAADVTDKKLNGGQ